MPQTGKYLVIIGLLIVLVGLITWFFGNKFSWFGNLPGDIKVEKENMRFYAPLASMLLVSAAVSILIWLVRKFLQ